MSSSRLSPLKKKELIELASDLGLSTEGLKSDLENRVSLYLLANHDTLSSNPKYAPYYGPLTGTPEPSRTRRRSVRKTPLPDEKTITVAPSPFRVNLPFFSPSRSSGDGAATAEGPDASTSLVQRGRVADALSTTRDTVYDQIATVASVGKQTNTKLRTYLSKIATVNKGENVYELGLLLNHLLPRTVKISSVKIPYGPLVSTPTVYVPNFCVLAEYVTFWQPLLFWAAYLIAFPLLVSYFVNFTHAKSAHSRGRHTFDPVIFNITKLLVAYILFVNLSTVSETVVSGSTTVTASRIVEPRILFVKSEPIVKAVLDKTPFIGGLIATLISLYTAILS